MSDIMYSVSWWTMLKGVLDLSTLQEYPGSLRHLMHLMSHHVTMIPTLVWSIHRLILNFRHNILYNTMFEIVLSSTFMPILRFLFCNLLVSTIVLRIVISLLKALLLYQ